MNPLSITVKNFLCYDVQDDGEPYVFNFRDHRLWSICGDNGAGKSAIFDAITYCLYGEHRGGSSRDDELVHRGASDMLARVEFEHGGKEYRVTRTIHLGMRPRKGTPSVKKECRMEWLREDGEWVDVPETSSVRGLEDAVHRILGFGSKTLTASVLLLQGKSDRLIDAGGKERFDILSGILDLTRFERLAERAKERAKQARAIHQQLSKLLEESPPPAEAEVAAAEVAAAAAEQVAQARQATRVEAGKVVEAAKEYRSRTERLAGMRSEEASMGEALREAPAITAAAKEAEVLEATLPRLGQALEAETQAAEADLAAKEATDAAAQVDVQADEKAATTADDAHKAARLAHQQALTQISTARAELEALAAEVGAANELSRLEAQSKATLGEIAELEAEFSDLAELRPRVQRLRVLEASRSLIASFRRAREALAEAEANAEDGHPEGDWLAQQGRRAECEKAAKQAVDAQTKAQKDLAGAEAKLNEARAILAAREDAGERGTCSHCGQSVPPKHIKEQIAAARSAAKAAEAAVATAQQSAVDATRCREKADLDVTAAKEAEAQAKERARVASRAGAEIHELEAGDDFTRLPEDVQALLAAPLDELLAGIADLRTEQTALPSLERELKQLTGAEAAATAKRGLIAEWERAAGKILDWRNRDQLAEAVARDAALQEELKGLYPQENSLRKEEEEASAALVAATEELNLARNRKRELEESARMRAQEAQGLRAQAKVALTGVGKAFLPVTAELIASAQARLAELDGAADRLAFLRRSESDLDGLRGQIKELSSLVEGTPEVHRVAAEVATQALDEASQLEKAAQAEARSERRAADALVRARTEGLKTQTAAEARAMERAVWDKVGQLLGRGGIQTALMRSALEDIQERANTMLNRISGGQLQLEVTCEQTSRGEEIFLRCLDAASAEQPVDVEFLSGGQRFRCAVALAAGIGQRAGADGAMPSQIIDEGFGSLDAQGRLEMLEEVREMSEFYERVIVVSHLESFHEQARFPARFELRKHGTRTVVTMVG